tara:strand:+ start:158 stop:1111 length:954 start_codon:yes stop_codon:yes gene_type:complete
METQDSTIKKKLLFTLGCSFTEGDGAYPEEPFFEPLGISLDCNEREKYHGSVLQNKLRNDNASYFHQNGWAPQLVKKLGYDKLINVGKCASSTSYQVKLLFDKYWNFPFHHYETLMIIYLTNASRFSFYSGGAPATFMAGNPNRPNSLSGRYAKIIQDHRLDEILEQIHHVKSLESFCKSKGITLKVMSYYLAEDVIMKRIYHTDVYMDSKKWDPLPFKHPGNTRNKTNWDSNYHSPICYHPNREGYRLMTERIYEKIKESYPELIRTDGFNDKPEIIWDGDWGNFPNIIDNRTEFDHEGLAPGEAEHYDKTGKPFM